MMVRRVCSFIQIITLALGIGATGIGQVRRAGASSKAQPRVLMIETLLPADILAVVFINNIAKLKDDLRQSKFYTLVNSKAPGEGLQRHFRDTVEKLSPASDVRYSVVAVEPRSPSTEYPSVAIVAEVQRAGTLESMTGKLSEKFSSANPKVAERGGAKITTVERSAYGEPLSFARIDNFLVFGQAAAVQKIIDNREARSKLGDLASFRLASEKFGSGASFAFVNLQRSLSFLLNRLSSGSRSGPVSLLVPALQSIGLSSLKAVTVSTSFVNGTAADDAHVIVDWTQKGVVTTLADTPSIEFGGARSLPEDVAAYVSTGINLNSVYDSLLNTLGPLIRTLTGAASVEEAVSQFESQLGFHIRTELLPSLGSEMVIAYAPSTAAGQPGADLEQIILLGVKNPVALSSIVEKIHARVTQGETSAGPPIEYKSYKIYPLQETTSLTVLNDFLVISTIGQTKRVIECRERGKVLAQRPEFSRVMQQKPAQAGIVFYFSNETFRWMWVRHALGGAAASDTLIEALRNEFNPPVYGFGQREDTGTNLTVSSPLGLVAGLDLLLASGGFDLGRKAKPEERQGLPVYSYLGLLAELSRLSRNDAK